MHLKTPAFILHKTKFNDHDIFVTLLTKSFGKIEAKVKGCRKHNAKYQSHFEILNLNDVILYKSGDRYSLIQSKIIDSYNSLKKNFDTLKTLFLISEITSKIIPLEQPFLLPSFDLIKSHLQALEKNPQKHILIQESFKIKLINMIGILANLKNCHVCNNKIENEHSFFTFKVNSIICPSCKEKFQKFPHNPFSLSPLTFNSLKILNFLKSNPLSLIQKISSYNLCFQEIGKISNLLIENHMNRELNTIKFFEK